MSFGIEFDIDDDDYEPRDEAHQVEDDHDGRNLVSDASDSSDDEAPSPSHRFDGLFKLTDMIRRQEQSRWLRHYADIEIPQPLPSREASLQENEMLEDKGVTDASSDADDESRQNAPLTHDSPREPIEPDHVQSEASDEEPLAHEPAEPESREGDNGKEGQQDQSSQTMPSYEGQRDRRQVDALSVIALALSLLSVLFAFLPVIGKVLWIIPAIPAVALALTAAFVRYEEGRSIRVALVALGLAICAVLLSFGVDTLYHRVGIIGYEHGTSWLLG